MLRRDFLAAFAAALPLRRLSAAEIGRHKITNVQTMMMQGGRTYTLVKITASNGMFGIGEAYGSPGIGVREQIDGLKPLLVGKDPLEIDTIYTRLGAGGNSLSGTRTDGSAHGLMRAASGIDMALWDLAGKILNVPSSTLLGGRFRERIRVYDHAAPKDMLDKASCKAWAESCKADPSGFTCHKFGFPHSRLTNRVLSIKDLNAIRQGFENCREAIGWDHDIMVHCHWEYDVRTALQIAEAVAPCKPLWLEDPLIVDYSDSWKRLTAGSSVPICMGENLARREGFLPFIVNQGCDILHPDLRNSGGFLETKRIADLAHPFGMPIATHNTASQVHTYGNIQWASTIHDYIATETVTGKGGWMDKVLLLDGPYIKGGHIEVPQKPGMNIHLNPDVVRAHLAPGETWWG
ncbi:MAG: mandelate racemase/muconate lactonizing enzyme family protein [Acidobacteria bacterium]|nr:mandelate racemase/muconate lactonizing enzyme family protein [Acidobacteriota bacterium]